jgi:hypothetical protein
MGKGKGEIEGDGGGRGEGKEGEEGEEEEKKKKKEEEEEEEEKEEEGEEAANSGRVDISLSLNSPRGLHSQYRFFRPHSSSKNSGVESPEHLRASLSVSSYPVCTPLVSTWSHLDMS